MMTGEEWHRADERGERVEIETGHVKGTVDFGAGTAVYRTGLECVRDCQGCVLSWLKRVFSGDVLMGKHDLWYVPTEREAEYVRTTYGDWGQVEVVVTRGTGTA
jgi:hypothetical protein